MNVLVLGIASLAGVTYIVIHLSDYFRASTELNQQLVVLLDSVEKKRVRLKEYEDRTEFLQEEIPRAEQRRSRLQEWVRLLNEQWANLQAHNRQAAANDPDVRKQAIQDARKRGAWWSRLSYWG
jgi:predicted nuclease with TOPRIM domain